jgi:hypothetical protein
MRYLLKLLCFGVLLAGLFLPFVPPAIALPFDNEFNVNEQGITHVEFEQISIADLGNVIAGGSISNEPIRREWKAGDPLSTVLHLGDVPTLGVDQFSLEQIAEINQQTAQRIPLSRYKLLVSQPISSLLEAIPFLGNFAVRDVAPIAALLANSTDDTKPIVSVVGQGDLGRRSLQDLGNSLDRFTLEDLPNAAVTPIRNFPGWEQQTFDSVPGLSHVPLSKMPLPLPNHSSLVARIVDISQESTGETVTGGIQVGFKILCPDKRHGISDSAACAGVLLEDLNDNETNQRRWVLGAAQVVPGGFGELKPLSSPMGFEPGYEPTGRNPFGETFKQILDTTGQTIRSSLVFRVCTPASCSPYNQFAVPFISYRVGDLIVIGADRVEGDENAFIPQTGQVIRAYQGQCTGETVEGISVGLLTTVFTQLLGQTRADWIGTFSCLNGECGRPLGQYQLFSNSQIVSEAIATQPGGEAWLKQLQSGYEPTSKEILQYFPPELQTRLLTQETKELLTLARSQTDPTKGGNWSDTRLIERTAQMFVGGKLAAVDSEVGMGLNKLGLHSYGKEAVRNYQAQGGVIDLHCNSNDLAQRAREEIPSTRIGQALSRLRVFSTVDGAGSGAAAWAVNQVLQEAGIKSVGKHFTYIPSVETALKERRGEVVAPENATVGDIVVASGGTHIGICLDQGCQNVRSNDGVREEFGWDSTTDFDGKFGGFTIYRITRDIGN